MLAIRLYVSLFFVGVVVFCTPPDWDRDPSLFPRLPIAVAAIDADVDVDVADLCQRHSDLYANHLNNMTLWAEEMWDATAKSTSGVLRGSIFQMGHFEQCLTARAPFETQYCLATVTAKLPKPDIERDPLSLFYHPQETVFQRLYKYDDISQQSRNVIKIGWCIPASCTTDQLQTYLNKYFQRKDFRMKQLNVSYEAQFSEEWCQRSTENDYFSGGDIAFTFVTIILIAIVVAVTVYDFNSTEEPLKKSLLYRLSMTFSARQNFNDLSKHDESNPALSILYGLRSVSILMIITAHRFGTYVSSALLNFDYIETQYRSLLTTILFHGDLFVDTFFILSGILVVYTLLNQFEKKIMNPGFMILVRYVRLTPAYAFVIFYYATLFNHTGNGPLWKVVAGGDSQDCRTNWWTNLLYISNYVHADHMCMTHSWYLPCDFHYFIIGLFLCILIKKERKAGLGALLAITLVSMAIPFVLTVVYQRPALLHFYPEFLTGPKVHPDFLLTYCKSHTRATPYFIGMFAGYLYYKLQGKEIHICKLKSGLLTLVSLLLMFVSVFVGGVFYNPYHRYDAVESGAYAALHRPAWALGSLGLLYTASYGHGYIINRVLTWSPLVPLSKLVYGTYLVHMQFQLRSAARFRNPRSISYFDVISHALSDMVLSFTFGLVLYLLVEAPSRRIFRELMMPKRPTKTLKVSQHTTSEDNIMNNKTTATSDSRL
ncbi:nose resistant to fluoxetine protein 6 [Aethina tumida]|uniref:nose resistant to fluoxetine protein 6 n=1 Tax=Aethina tumida TaxID=116153 RepID=UPI002147DF2C|nr:nose resistant to fluoxetine protein 6 [Aethina tumida]